MRGRYTWTEAVQTCPFLLYLTPPLCALLSSIYSPEFNMTTKSEWLFGTEEITSNGKKKKKYIGV